MHPGGAAFLPRLLQLGAQRGGHTALPELPVPGEIPATPGAWVRETFPLHPAGVQFLDDYLKGSSWQQAHPAPGVLPPCFVQI